MDRNITPLFSTPLYSTVLESIPEKENLMNVNFHRGGYNNAFLSVDKNILDKFEQLQVIIQEEINNYLDVLLVKKHIDFKVNNSWVVKHIKGDWSQTHIHSNSVISGVLYLKVNENSGDIIFRKQIHDSGVFSVQLDIEYSDQNIFNMREYKITPIENQLILFPSTLPHDVTMNMSDEDRYVLAFNCSPIGKIGSDRELNTLFL